MMGIHRYGMGLAAILCAVALSGCSDSSGGVVKRTLSGVATSVVDKMAQADRDFVVVDLAKSDDPGTEENETIVATGTSDAIGAFSAKLGIDITTVFVAFPATEGDPRTSGLFSLVDGDVTGKTLENFTDIACVAGVQIVSEGVVEPRLLDTQRIANLEAGAQEVLATQSVDFNDSDSFNAAVQRTRELTNDGANPPQG